MHLSKAYNCLPHGLMVVKFEAYGIGKLRLNSFLRYLSNQKWRAKVNSSYSDRSDIIRSIAQGSILGPLLCNIYL